MSQVSIANRALAYIGANKITSLSEGTQEANAISNVYSDSLRSILSEAPWVFALKRSLLNKVQITPSWGRGNYFSVPADMVRIFGTMTGDEWRQEGKYIFSDTDQFGIIYTYKETDDAVYSPSFVDAFAVRLAADVAYDLTNASSKQMELIQYYKSEMLPIARSINAQSRSAKPVKDDLWVNAILRG
jgi:hypothetical protein